MKIRDFTFQVGDLLLWVCTDSLFVVVERYDILKGKDTIIKVKCVDGGRYPEWLHDERPYNRISLTKGRDFKIVTRAKRVKNTIIM